MSEQPYVSVIMPVFNTGRRLLPSISSVLAQTYQDFELIIVDDGSTDHTPGVLYGLLDMDPRITLVTQENAGPAAARNRGIRAARGRIIAFIDADDLWHPNRLQMCLGHFGRNPQAGIVFSRVGFWDAESGKVSTITRHFEQLDVTDLLAENPICTTSNIVARSSLLGRLDGFKENLAYIEDQDLALRAAGLTPWTVEGVDAVLVKYRCADDSRSSQLAATAECWKQLMAESQAFLPRAVQARARVFEGAFYRNLARRALRPGGSVAEAARALWQAFMADPLILVRAPKRTAKTLAGLCLFALPLSQTREMVQ